MRGVGFSTPPSVHRGPLSVRFPSAPIMSMGRRLLAGDVFAIRPSPDVELWRPPLRSRLRPHPINRGQNPLDAWKPDRI